MRFSSFIIAGQVNCARDQPKAFSRNVFESLGTDVEDKQVADRILGMFNLALVGHLLGNRKKTLVKRKPNG